MVLPEFPLLVGTARRLSCLPRAGVELVKREIPIGKFHPVAIVRQKAGQGGLNLPAVGTMEIRKLDDRYRCLPRTANRSALCAHVHPIDRGRLQMNDDVRLRTKRADKCLMLCCTSLSLKLRSNLIAVVGARVSGLIGLIIAFDILISYRVQLGANLDLEKGRNG